VNLVGLFEIFLLGLANLRRNKLRSFLTMLGMIFGVGSVIAMLSVGAGARHEILSRLGQLGVQNIIVNSVKPPQEKKPQGNDQNWIDRYGLTFKDAESVREVCPSAERVFPVNVVKQPVWYGSTRVDASVMGVLPEQLRMFRLEVGRGRPFNDIDAATEAKVCVVRKSLVRELGAIRDPIGLVVRIGGYPFEIIGILREEEFASPTRKALAIDDRAHEVYVPYSTSMRTFGHRDLHPARRQRETLGGRARPDDRDGQVGGAGLSDRQDPRGDPGQGSRAQGLRDRDPARAARTEREDAGGLQRGDGADRGHLAGRGRHRDRQHHVGDHHRADARDRRPARAGATRGDIVVQFLTETAAIGMIGGLFGCPVRAGRDPAPRPLHWLAGDHRARVRPDLARHLGGGGRDQRDLSGQKGRQARSDQRPALRVNRVANHS
jgi:hypothetical protein